MFKLVNTEPLEYQAVTAVWIFLCTSILVLCLVKLLTVHVCVCEALYQSVAVEGRQCVAVQFIYFGINFVCGRCGGIRFELDSSRLH